MASFLSSLIGTRPAPTRTSTDVIVPVRPFDDCGLARKFILAWMYRFDDVLNVEKIQSSLAELIEIPSWRHVGGRLRQNSEGKLELHIPQVYTPDRPAFRFSQSHFHDDINAHPLAAQLPTATPQPSIHPGSKTFEEFMTRPGAPSTIDGYLYTDEPLLALHITSFANSTLVAISFPHVLGDAMAISSLMSAISLVMAGRKAEVPVLPDLTHDVLANIGQRLTTGAPEPEPYVLADQKLSGLRMFLFALNYAKEMFWHPKTETRTGCLPAAFVRSLRNEAEAEIAKDDFKHPPPPFLSDGDILAAWGTLMVLQCEPHPRPAMVPNVLSLRNRFPSTTGGTYMQNLLIFVHTILSVEEVASASLGSIAAKLRLTLLEQTTQPQLDAVMRDYRVSISTLGIPAFYGDSNSRLVVLDNWDKTKMFEAVDLSPAVVRGTEEAAAAPGGDNQQHRNVDDGKRARQVVGPGRLRYHNSLALGPNAQDIRYFWNIIGKDLEGNYWFNASLRPDHWRRIEMAMGV